MGQQQLLLVILVTIIVGIATVVAINIFGTAADQANRDAVRQDLLAAAAQAQAVYARPEMMAGTGGDFTNLTEPQLLNRLNIPGDLTVDGDNDEDSDITNENATYTLTRTANQVVITGVPSGGSEDIVLTLSESDGTWTFGWND